MSLSLGSHTHSIPNALYKGNRDRVASALRETKKIQNATSSYVILKGGTEDEFGFYDTDTTQTTFRQVSHRISTFLISSFNFVFLGIVLPISVWRF